jgi:plastocyanin
MTLLLRGLCAGAAALAALPAHPAHPQSVMGHTPNLRPAWTAAAGQTVLRIGHRFEIMDGGNELLNIPTLSAGVGLGRGLAVGLDYTSNSEIVPGRLGAAEVQPWLAATLRPTGALDVGLVAAWNSAARSADAGLTLALRQGPFTLQGEGRGFTDALGGGHSGASASAGLIVRLTAHLELSGDVGRMLRPDSLGTVWSAGASVAIPRTPHTLSLHATNGGATTLQGAAHPKVIGPEPVRYGFVFSIPLGSRRQWGEIFQRGASGAESLLAQADAVVEMRMLALSPREVRIRAGQTVAWINRDPLAHTVTADDASWMSGTFGLNEVFIHRFAKPGRYTYFCIPHPDMRGVVVVEEAGRRVGG